jgi:hypothetical protein
MSKNQTTITLYDPDTGEELYVPSNMTSIGDINIDTSMTNDTISTEQYRGWDVIYNENIRISRRELGIDIIEKLNTFNDK